jgi:hypothetical protein
MITEYGVNVAAVVSSLALTDVTRSRTPTPSGAPVDEVAEQHQGGVTAGPAVSVAQQACGGKQGFELASVAVDIAHDVDRSVAGVRHRRFAHATKGSSGCSVRIVR